jgi:hypothetical protein
MEHQKIIYTFETYQWPWYCFPSPASSLYVQLSFWAFGEGALGGCEKVQEFKGEATMVAAEEQKTGKQ